ncbi:MAG: PorT family protein [Bacteroidales bacterium]|nr:PorT family protein [Bacteroidales bacterium]
MYRKILLSLLTLCLALPLFAQRQGVKNIPYIDQRRMHWGFLLGVNSGDLRVVHSGKNDWFAESPTVNPAFVVGLLGDMALTEHLNLRCTPSLYFQSREVKFHNALTDATRSQTLKTNYLSIPLSLKVATHRVNNYRPYMLFGASIDYDLAHEKEEPIVFKHVDVGIHTALGCDFYLPYFKFCPELRFNLGLLDMIDHKRKGLKDQTLMPYTDAISSAKNKGVSLIFFFE